MLTLETLKEYGADVNTGLSRCANNEALYLRLVRIAAMDLSTDALGKALSEGDFKTAFEVAHKLKGGLSNLALTPVAEPVGKLTDLLRTQTPVDYSELYARISEQAKALTALL